MLRSGSSALSCFAFYFLILICSSTSIIESMKTFFINLLFACITYVSVAQMPSISYIDIPGTETDPTLVPAGTGGYYLTNNITKSNPDSIFASITYLDANLAPQWNRLLKSRAYTIITGAAVENGGLSVMLNVYNSQSANQAIPVFYQLDQNGNTVETIELQDSANAALTTSQFFNKIKLADGSRVFNTSSAGVVVHVNAQGQADYSRQFRFRNSASNLLSIRALAAVPGTNQWFISGNISNTNLAFLMKMQDTTMLNVHVFNFNPFSNATLANIHVLPNQEVLLGWNDASRKMHNVKLSASGNIIWHKIYKMTAQMNPGRMTVASNGDIWMHGSVTPGQAGGLLVHLSPNGQFIGRKGQFKLGNSHGNMSTIVELPNNELLTMQRGFYSSKPVLFLNRIQTSMNFYCFDSNVGNFIDTTYATADSLTTQIKPVVRRFGSKQTLTVPLKIQSQIVEIGNVVCTPTDIDEELFSKERFTFYPNPATKTLKVIGLEGQPEVRIVTMDGRVLLAEKYSDEISVSNLPAGLYVLDIPSLGLRKRFAKE